MLISSYHTGKIKRSVGLVKFSAAPKARPLANRRKIGYDEGIARPGAACRANLDVRMEKEHLSMRYCKKCTMPDTRPGITFDEQGVCSACRHYENRKKCGLGRPLPGV